MSIYTSLFPGGKKKALTMSYDDGIEQDRRLIQILNVNGIKGTFNLNSGLLHEKYGWESKGVQIRHINANEVKELYRNHEVAVHALTHPFLERLPKEMIIREIYEDRKNLEELVGYPVRGMAYPFGTYDKRVLEVLDDLGIEYSRTVKSHGTTVLPEAFLEWHPTCHHNDPELMNKLKTFLSIERQETLSVLYVWGHSYEFDTDNNWHVIEEFCKLAGGHDDIWYATNIEIVDYMKSIRKLKFALSGDSVYNLNAQSIWIQVDGNTVELKPGMITKLT